MAKGCHLVVYEDSPEGRAAVRHAAGLARASEAPLVVLALAPQAPLDSGCLRCRGSAAIWNRAMVEVAEEELAQARELLLGQAAPDVRYVVERGDAVPATLAAAAREGADCVIVPARRRRSPRRSLAARLGATRSFRVLIAPPAA